MTDYTFTDDGEIAHVKKDGMIMTAEEMVRELRERDQLAAPYWADEPENEPANNAPTWADAPEWADCYGKVGIGSKTIWYNNEQYSYADGVKNGVYWFDNPSNHNLARVTLIERRPTNAPTWDGQGLPPVGHPCQITFHCDYPPNWHDAVVKYYGGKITVVEIDGREEPYCPLPNTVEFRERPKKIDLRMATVERALATYKNANPDDRSRTRMLEELYDNGMLTLPENDQ